MADAGIEVSLFIAPDPKQVEAAARIGAEFIELHTGAFAETISSEAKKEQGNRAAGGGGAAGA